MRILLYTGKGGVGKTTISAATALRCAELGHKTLVISTDGAHSLGDSFDKPVGPDPTPITEKLCAQEIDVHQELQSHWGTIHAYISQVLRKQGLNDLVAQELAILPGMEELFNLLKLQEYAGTGEFDVVVVDCAPTAATARLLSLPDALRWYMERFFPVGRKILNMVRPVAEKITKFPLPHDDVYASMENLYRRIEGIHGLLTGPDTSIRLVIQPEKMVIKEAQRAYASLSLFGYRVDAVAVNRLFPNEWNNPALKKWVAIQKRHLKEAKDRFDPLPLLISPYFEEEIVGVALLSQMAHELFGDKDPTATFYNENPIDIRPVNGDYLVSILLPGTDKEDLKLWVKGDELIIQLKEARRHIFLPHTLARLQLKKAALQDGRFQVYFGNP